MKLKTNAPNWLYLLCAVCFFIFLGYDQILFMRPQSIHFIRQTDSLSFISHYLRYGMKFFEPGTLNLDSPDGKAACEFPIVYYCMAWLYKLFGEHEYFLRLFHVLVVFAGFYGVYSMLRKLFQDFVYALLLTFILMGSTVLLYYTNNFLPDAGALGCTLIGLFLFQNYAEDHTRLSQGMIGLLLMTLGSLLKATFFIYPLASFGALLFNEFFFKKTSLKDTVQKHKWIIAGFFTGLFCIASWNIYARLYNEWNHTTYFLTRILPIWIPDKKGQDGVWEHIFGYWYKSYFPVNTHIFLYVIIPIGILFGYKANRHWYVLTLLSGIGAICYFLLFFVQFQYHDYYFFAIIPAIIVAAANGLVTITWYLHRKYFSYILKAALLVICFYGITDAKKGLWDRYRYHPDDQNDQIAKKVEELSPLYTAAGVPPDARFIFICDGAKNGGLYFAKRVGWRASACYEIHDIIDTCIKQQAAYVFFTDTAYVREANISGWLQDKIVQSENAVLYSLRRH